ncbi:MAG: ComF family protein [Oscillospiraceae bacterium]|nr:ComF family protein [Oscillospiraceae bacterium]
MGFAPCCDACEAALPSVRREAGQALDKTRHTLGFVDVALAPFQYLPPVKGAILRFKFAGRVDLAAFFAQELFFTINTCKTLPVFDIIVAVPSGKRELRRRGYDVPALLASALAKRLGVPFIKGALIKPYDTTPQMQLRGDARRANLIGAFEAACPEQLAGKQVLLVDDVITTGATVNECAKTVRLANAKGCSAVCIAVAGDEASSPATGNAGFVTLA